LGFGRPEHLLEYGRDRDHFIDNHAHLHSAPLAEVALEFLAVEYGRLVDRRGISAQVARVHEDRVYQPRRAERSTLVECQHTPDGCD